MPVSCGSYFRMNDDDSIISRVCEHWGMEGSNFLVGKWGHDLKYGLGRPEHRLFDHPAFVYPNNHWFLFLWGRERWECDDFKVRVSSGDFWKVFVR